MQYHKLYNPVGVIKSSPLLAVTYGAVRYNSETLRVLQLFHGLINCMSSTLDVFILYGSRICSRREYGFYRQFLAIPGP
jgi:ABC-type multidrug transport system permease subunit